MSFCLMSLSWMSLYRLSYCWICWILQMLGIILFNVILPNVFVFGIILLNEIHHSSWWKRFRRVSFRWMSFGRMYSTECLCFECHSSSCLSDECQWTKCHLDDHQYAECHSAKCFIQSNVVAPMNYSKADTNLSKTNFHKEKKWKDTSMKLRKNSLVTSPISWRFYVWCYISLVSSNPPCSDGMSWVNDRQWILLFS